MGYDDLFYKKYEEYLKEPSVRNAHDLMFGFVCFKFKSFLDVIDLGCGRSQEFLRYTMPTCYYGVDENISQEHFHYQLFGPPRKQSFCQGNYKDKKLLSEIILKQQPKSFVSLFSSEIMENYKSNYEFYNWLFKTFPHIETGLVSGFYYESKKNQNPIIENGDLVSYQTIENFEDCKREGFTEKRILLPVPSKLFGNDVIEVWKIFERI